MNQTIEDRMQYVDKQLKELRKELERDLAKYRDSGYLIKRKKAERQEALANPNTTSIEDAFNYMFEGYKVL